MAAAAPHPDVVALDDVSVVVEPWSWPFAVERRHEIDAHFAQRQRVQPTLWNGRVLLVRRYEIRGRVLHGSCFETDYASFLAAREWNFPDPNVFNIFASAALRAGDGGFLLGQMAPSTASAGQLYFPCGTPDPADVCDGALDLAGSLGRELYEETGIDIATLDVEPGWTLVHDGGFLALMRQVVSSESAETLRSRILHHLASETSPEFSDIRIVRGVDDLDISMPRFMVIFLTSLWQPRAQAARS